MWNVFACDLPSLHPRGPAQAPPSQPTPRVSRPPEGDVINGHHIPGGTYIGTNSWGTQLDEVYGNDADIFRPEGWLIEDQERLKAMHRTHEVVFGFGATKCLGVSLALMEMNKVLF
jgi:cytochrome P450